MRDFNVELQNLKLNLEKLNKEIENAQTHLHEIETKADFPKETDTLAKLKNASDKMVEIEIGLGKIGSEKKTGVLKLENGNVSLDGKGSYPITGINNHGIKSIVDAETKEVVFENPWYDENDLSVQDGKLFGKKFAVKKAEEEIDNLKRDKEKLAEKIEEMGQLAEIVPTLIEKGENLVFPSMANEWREYVNENAPTSLKELQSAVELMETLSKDETLNKANKQAEIIFERSKWSQFNSTLVLNAVTSFSQQGPEFYQKVTGENPKWVQEVAKQNAKLKEELSANERQ